jgi:hypothetical protein
MIAHNAAIECRRLAMIHDQTFEGRKEKDDEIGAVFSMIQTA